MRVQQARQDLMFKKASSATHDALVARLAGNPALLLDVLRRAWPQVFNGAKDSRITALHVERPIVVGGRLNASRGKGGWVAGFVDLAVGAHLIRSVTVIGATAPITTVQKVQEVFYVEVKSGKIHLGELMRQINLYRAYGNNGYWVVVGPDDRYTDLLWGQDIAFVRMMVPQQRET